MENTLVIAHHGLDNYAAARAQEEKVLNGAVKSYPIHHTISHKAFMRAIEHCRASGEVLLVDELGEFPRAALDILDAELRTGGFTCVAWDKPCACGRHPHSSCSCTESQVAKYQSRVPDTLKAQFNIIHI